MENHFTTRHFVVLGLIWTSLILFFAWWVLREERDNITRLAITQARASFGKDQAIRQWATRHGRIYVPVSDYFQPNPRMAKVAERDITTPSGRLLTLINPDAIIHQLDRDYGHLYGTSGKITSLSATAENRPDAWEHSALARIANGANEVLEFVEGESGEFLRLMQPLMVTPGCLLCHANEGMEVGKPGGAIAISLPMDEFRLQERQAIRSKLAALVLLWLFGLVGLSISAWILRRQQHSREQALLELKRSEARHSAIVHTSLDSIVTIDQQGRIVEFNPAAEKTFGYTADEVLGKPMAERLIPKSLREQHLEGLKRHLATQQSHILGTRIETTALRRDGTEFPVELSITRIEQQGTPLFTAFLRDITERRKLEQQLLKQASEDDLTGLLNRHTFEASLRRILVEGDDQGQFHHCLMYLDLDRFKIVNDTGGHRAGDELLKQLAELMRNTVGNRGTLGRLGGDEFGLVLPNHSLEEGKAVAGELLHQISEFRFYWEDKIFSLGMSIGLVAIDNPHLDTSKLLGMADAACYRAKEEGRNRCYVYSASDNILTHRRAELDWINRIESAFEEERFVLCQQPIIALGETGPQAPFTEILLRMRDPDTGNLISPDKFLPAAERYNLMPIIDRWVVRNTLRWLAAQPDFDGLISINLSGASLTDTLFLNFVLAELEHKSVDGHYLCFEITETEAIANLSRARRFIAHLREAGCRFSLDDFGSGMSSYAYLKDLPVDFLKIDGRFVRNLDTDPISLAMVKSIHEIGHIMGKQTIAEFVGSSAILKCLEELGINYAQGFYLGRPLPLAEKSVEISSVSTSHEWRAANQSRK